MSYYATGATRDSLFFGPIPAAISGGGTGVQKAAPPAYTKPTYWQYFAPKVLPWAAAAVLGIGALYVMRRRGII